MPVVMTALFRDAGTALPHVLIMACARIGRRIVAGNIAIYCVGFCVLLVQL